MSDKVLLFSYGTLQDTTVQLETFGRMLPSHKDQLLGYKLETVKIDDAKVQSLSSKNYHPIAVKSTENTVDGMVFEISKAELAYSDKYEVSAYRRVMGKLNSGKQAWVYVQA